MYLRRLELRGFKSFVTQTSIDLEPGITAIVGPNGSGKSNVADALRWVLGEQNLRQMRGRKVQDVIWSGSATRGPVGMAEVRLALDNANGWLEVPYRDVSIGRRIVRSGESNYLLNGTRVRLRDVTDVLAKGASANRGYGLSVDRAVLAQGAVDAVLALRPLERVAAFEDSAGVRPFQSQREDALRKLSAAKGSLQRLEDIASELAPRLPQLKRAADRARRYQHMQQQFAQVSGQLFRARFVTARHCLLVADKLRLEASLEAAAAAWSYDELQKLVAADATAYESATQEAHAVEQTLRDVRSRLGESQSQIDILTERLLSRQRRALDVEARIVSLDDKLAHLAIRLVASTNAVRSTEEELLAARSQAETTKLADSQADQAHSMASQNVSYLRTQLSDAERDGSRRRHEEKAEYDRVAAIERDIESLVAEATHVETRLDGLNKQYEAADAEVGSLEHELRDVELDRGRLASLVERSERDFEEARMKLQSPQKEHLQLVARRRALADLQYGLAATRGGNALLQQQRRSLPDLGDPVTTLIRVPAGFEMAARVIFGATLEALTASSLPAAIASIDLAIKHQTTATVLAMDGSPGVLATLTADDIKTLKEAGGKGWLGCASDIIDLNGAAGTSLATIVASWLVVRELEDARRVLTAVRDCHQPFTMNIATKSGVGIQANGLVYRVDENDDHGRLGRAREIDELDTKLAAINRNIATLQGELLDLEKRRTDLVSQRSAAERHAKNLQEEVRTAQRRRHGAQRQLDQEMGEARGRARQRERLATQLADAQQRVRELPAHADASAEATIRARLSEATRVSEARRASLSAIREDVHRLDLAVTRAEQRLAAHMSDQEREKAARGEAEHERERLRSQRHELATVLATTDAQLRSFRIETSARREEARQAEANLASIEESSKSLRQRWQHNRSREAELRTLWTAKVQSEESASSARSRAEAQLSLLEEQIRLELGVSTESVERLPVPSEHEERLKEKRDSLADNLRQLGNVNLEADREYTELSERCQYLQSQIDDLTTAMRELDAISSDLQHLIDQQFRQAFEMTSVAFARYFKRLLNGGDARLCLNHDDSGAATVDITVRLPGKRAQDLAALSGGERALVATALLFAMIEARPIPFCLLDEADASLDDANVDRFCELLRELETQTQFIVITHNRATMQAATALYGVTMDRDGASHIVSWRLSELDRRHSVVRQ